MRRWLYFVGRACIPALWFLFGELLYRFLRHRSQPPELADLVGYLEIGSSFVLSYATVGWWRDRRARSQRAPD